MFIDLAVMALLGKNPFPDAPPKYIRATLYHYHFTDIGKEQQWSVIQPFNRLRHNRFIE